MPWIDTHCHLDAVEFAADRDAVRARARAAGVQHCVIPAVQVANFAAVRALAHQHADSYGLGIHPLYVAQAAAHDLQLLEQALQAQHGDARLVAVGEIGLDYFVPQLQQSPLREQQEHFFRAQLQLARRADLALLLHVRRSVDRVLLHLRDIGRGRPWRGIAHAFNGSAQQAQALLDQGLTLGFGGALTYARATQLRQRAQTLPLTALVLETDAPDIPPHWLYTPAAERTPGWTAQRNEPAELVRIASALAALRGIDTEALARASTANACKALPRLAPLLGTSGT